MIDIDSWLRELAEDKDAGIRDHERYQRDLFEEYVLRRPDHRQERQDLYRRYRSGERIMGEHGLRRELAAFDLGYFGRAYLRHYFKRESPGFHEDLDDLWMSGVLKGRNPGREASLIAGLDGSRNAVAAPRGHAKSTNFTFKDDLHAVLYGYKHYIIILSDSSDQAEGFLDDIKTELEENADIIMDFGHLKGEKAWRSNVILTKNDVKVEAIGSGKKVRGRRHHNWRPDLIVLDDVENDENVVTPEQRRKLAGWFYKAVSKAGDTYTDIMYIGTILHYDSLLSKVLKNPEYKTTKYRAVIHEAKNQKLWEEWERIYTNLFDEDHQQNARTFYEAHESEMLEGTEVLWDAKWSYYDLMKMKVSEGEASFNSEMQNDPIDPETATFQEEWFDFYEEGDVDFKDPRFLFIGANDPSLGKNRRSDTSSIIGLMLDTRTGYMYVAEGDIARRKPDAIIRDILEIHRRYRRDFGKGFYRFGVEVVQFQYFFKEVLKQVAMEEGEYLPVEEIQSVQNKMLRIESLQPLIKNHYIKFSRKHKSLLKQLTEFPMGANDDGPDGLQMAAGLAQSIRAVTAKAEYRSVLRRRCRYRRGAY